jgi:predicted kinase
MNNKASLVLMSGSPLSGKTTLAREIKKHFSDDCVIISTDEIRKEITNSYEDHSKENAVWAEVTKRTLSSLKTGKVVIIDATLRQKEVRMKHLSYYKDYPIYYIAFEKLDIEILKERNDNRKFKRLDEETLVKMWNEYEVPTDDELVMYRQAMRINNDNSAEKLPEMLAAIDRQRKEEVYVVEKLEKILDFLKSEGVEVPTEVKNSIEDVFAENDNVENVDIYFKEDADLFGTDLTLINEVNSYLNLPSKGNYNNVFTYYGEIEYSLSEFVKLYDGDKLIDNITNVDKRDIPTDFRSSDFAVVLVERVKWEQSKLVRTPHLYVYCPQVSKSSTEAETEE